MTLRFFGGWTPEEREDTKLTSLSEFSYYMKWSDFIVEYASLRYHIQFSVSDITVQHWWNTLLTEVVKRI